MRLPDISIERYIAFLLSTLPKLAQKNVYPHWWRLPMRQFAVLDRALRAAANRPGLGLEFGVFRGASLTRAARKQPHRRFFGFDSFEGLPVDGRPDWKIDFAVSTLPQVPANCRLVPGWFNETLPAFVAANRDPIAFINIDCDLYSSTHEVFFGLGNLVRPGIAFYFDELVNYDSFLWNEMLALFELLEATGFGIEWIALHRRLRGLEEVFHHYENDDYPHWRTDFNAGYRLPAAGLLTSHNTDLGLLDDKSERARIRLLAAKFEQFTEKYQSLWASKPEHAGV